MSRHIPRAQPSHFWTTGQYLYDYRDQQYGIGAMLQMILIGDLQTNKPYIGIFEFQTEALGKFSSQLTVTHCESKLYSPSIINQFFQRAHIS